MKTKWVENKNLKKKGSSPKTKTCAELISGKKQIRRLKKKGGSVNIKAAKAINTLFLDLRTSIEDCEKVIKAFKKLGYTTYYDAKTKVIKTTAPKTRIKKLSKLYDCIQSYSLIQKKAKNEPK